MKGQSWRHKSEYGLPESLKSAVAPRLTQVDPTERFSDIQMTESLSKKTPARPRRRAFTPDDFREELSRFPPYKSPPPELASSLTGDDPPPLIDMTTQSHAGPSQPTRAVNRRKRSPRDVRVDGQITPRGISRTSGALAITRRGREESSHTNLPKRRPTNSTSSNGVRPSRSSDEEVEEKVEKPESDPIRDADVWYSGTGDRTKPIEVERTATQAPKLRSKPPMRDRNGDVPVGFLFFSCGNCAYAQQQTTQASNKSASAKKLASIIPTSRPIFSKQVGPPASPTGQSNHIQAQAAIHDALIGVGDSPYRIRIDRVDRLGDAFELVWTQALTFWRIRDDIISDCSVS